MSTIVNLLNQVNSGEIVLPAIQRDFVWSERKAERLLDSIMRGYPIGLALLWETYSDIQYRSFVRDYVPDAKYVFNGNSSKRKKKVVLDGQQRLQSLYVALFGSYERKPLYLDLLSGSTTADLSDERFIFWFLAPNDAKSKNATPRSEIQEQVPYLLTRVSELFKMSAAERRELVRTSTKRLELADEESALLELNLAQFDSVLSRDQNILRVATIDEDLSNDSAYRKSEADVLEIFVRVNREGTPLSRSDLIFSMLKLNWKESAEALPDFVRAINEGNSFDIDTDFVIRCLFAASDLGTRMDLDLLRKPANVTLLQDNFSECCKAIQATMDFVQGECRCSSAELVGGLNNLVPFVYYAFRLKNHDIPNAARQNLRRSLFLFAFSRAFSRYGDSRLGAFIRNELQPLADSGDTDFPFAAAVRSMAKWERITDFDESLLAGNIKLALHLLQGRATTKVKYSRNAPEIDHIFPRSTLREKGYRREDINDLGNYWILARTKNENKSNKHPGKYLADVNETILKQAAIDRKRLDYRQYPTFVRDRRAAILERVRVEVEWPKDAYKTVP